MKRHRLLLACLVLAALISNIAPRASASESDHAALTLMVYMCGSNLESKGGAGSRDLLEMAASGYDPDKVNVLVMTGGSKRWALGQPKDSICIYTPEGDNLRMVEAFESASMGDPATLASLLDYGYSNCPADRYALILWDHGGGPMNGVCLDELYDSDTLTLEELFTALSASPAVQNKLEWIGFDACLMGSAEVAAAMRPFARYMIASEETEPGGGWDYSFLAGIENDPDGGAAGRRIIDRYFENSQDGFVLTLSCVDLTGLDALQEAMDALFGALEISSGNYASFSYAAGSTRSFGKVADDSYSYDLIDLSALVRTLGAQDQNAAQKIVDALESCVVYTRSSEPFGGLSIYHPYDNKTDYAETWSALYPTLGFSAGYTDYIARFASYLFGNSEVSWEDLRGLPTVEPSVYALPLSDSQADSVSSSVMNLLRWNEEDGTYSGVCTVNQVTLDGRVLYGVDPGKMLAAADEGGSPLTGAIPYEILPDGSFGIYANYCREEAAQTGEAAALIHVDTRGGRRDFGSYNFDTDETAASGLDTSSNVGSTVTVGSDVSEDDLEITGSSALSELISSASVTTEQVAPLTGNLSESLSVPDTVPLSAALPSIVSAADTSLIHATSGQGDAAITPVSTTVLSVANSSYRLNQTGSAVDLDTLTPVSMDSFSPEERIIDLTHWTLPSDEETPLPAVIHTWLKCGADEEGNVTVLETWIYDEESNLWSTRNILEPKLYTTIAFPVACKLPAAEDNALVGFESWETQYTTAASISADSLRLCFVPDPNRENRCVSFQITDIQNRTFSSVPLLIDYSLM